jgi:hypothetical protein
MEVVDTNTTPFMRRLEGHLNNGYLRDKYSSDRVQKYAEEHAKLDIVERLYRRGFRMSTTNPYRSICNFDVSVTFREYKGGIYVIPYCEGTMRNVLDFLAKDRRLRDYHYQNQTDRPTRVPARQWRERAKVWDALTEQARWGDYLMIDICSWSKWWQLNPAFEMTAELHKRILGPAKK